MTVDELISGLADLPESLASAFVRRFPAMAYHSDDLIRVATDALFQAARKFNANRGMTFRNYADMCISRRLNWTRIDIMRRTKPLESQHVDNDAGCNIIDSRSISTKLPDDFYLRLTRHQIRVICLRFEGGYSFSQIARKCGCSKVNAFKIYRRGLKRLDVSMSHVV